MKKMIVLLAALIWGSLGPALACDLPRAPGEVLLTLDGAVSNCNTGAGLELDAAMFAALPRTRITTTNPWEKAEVEYEGVTFAELLKFAGASGSTVTVWALNDYHAAIPVADLLKYGVLLADRRNGQLMRVRDKGPYFVVFPFDKYPELRSEDRFAQSVWQVMRLTIMP